MARRIKWSRLNSRDRMQQQGVEDKKADSVDPPKTRSLKDRPSQAELREQATAAFLAWRARQTSEKNKKIAVARRIAANIAKLPGLIRDP